MHEIELKFQVPEPARHAVRRAVGTTSARTTRLRARYHDTADRRLAAAGAALRLRLEGAHWVQTFKSGGRALGGRLEHEVTLAATPGVPALDLARHAGSAAEPALRAALGLSADAPWADAPPLELVFETDVQRTHRLTRTEGARVELALDVGHLRAQGREAPLWELEFELVEGTTAALARLCASWVQRHGLWLDVRSKAERGQRLALDQACGPVQAQQPAALQPGQAVDAGLRQMVGAVMQPLMVHASELAGGVGQSEHLHQLRVGLRRLRSLLRLFGGADTGVPAAWDAALAAVFRRLGASRDRDVLAELLQPALAAAGEPALALPEPASGEAPGAVLREPATTRLWLELLTYAETPLSLAPASDELSTLAAARLRRLHRKLGRAAARAAELDDEARHRLRRQIKRLRYGVEATAPLWPPRQVKRYLDALRTLQDALGAYTDVDMGQAVAAGLDGQDPAVAFARGWLAARREPLLAAAVQALADWPKPPKAWQNARECKGRQREPRERGR